MGYLLDTHTAIWALGDKSKLSSVASEIISDNTVPIKISVASAWEIAIKVSLGKIIFPRNSTFFLNKMRAFGVDIVGITDAHLNIIETLPFIHKDPFDRIIIATSIANNLTLITNDADIQKYNVSWVW